jgi:signal transduction histidine kinase
MGYSQTTAILQVKVVDVNENPVSGATIVIENGKPVTTDRSGRYKLFLDKKPSLPLKVKAIKDGYRLSQLNFDEEEGTVEIILSVVVKEQKVISGIIKVLKNPGVPVAGIQITYHSKKYITDNQGVVKVSEKVDVKKIKIENKKIEAIKDDAALNIVLVTISEEEQPADDNTRFVAYKNSIENITSEIEEDGKQLVKDLVSIQQEISSITEKLKGDQNLTPARKKELKAYVDTLELTLSKRRMEFEEASVKTSSLIGILKKEIFSKDSLYNAAKQQLASKEEEEKKTNEEYARNVIIYSVGIFLLLTIAIVLYVFTMKLNRQKKQLEESNAELLLQQSLVEEKNKQLDTFVYRASHDIKGPLKSVIGLTNVGLMAIKDPEALNYFDHISKSTKKLLKTLDNLLLLTKAERTQIKLEQVNIASLIEQALSSFENAESFKEIEFNINIEKGMTLESDETVLFSIFQNLIENGIKYHDPAKPQPYVDIIAKYEGGKGIIKFTDNGLGVDKKHHAKIFDMFYKINDGSSGTGLGLHIVKQLVENLGGVIKLESEVGKGSTFSLVFPLNK